MLAVKVHAEWMLGTSQERTGVRSADPEGAVAELGPLRRASAAAVTALSTAPGEGRPPCALTHASPACSALSPHHDIAQAYAIFDAFLHH